MTGTSGAQKLVSRAEFDVMTPKQQGYVSYMQAMLLGSEIPEQRPTGVDQSEWEAGRFSGVLAEIDSEC